MRHLLAALLLVTASNVVMADGTSTKLFKVILTRDEVTIGFGKEMDLERIGSQLTKTGYIQAWQYATGRGEQGALVQKPVREAVIMAAQVVRIEVAEHGQPVIAPPGR